MSRRTRPESDPGDRAFAIDTAAVAVVSVAICVASNALLFMTALVPAVLAVRFVAWSRTPFEDRRGTVRGEAAFFALCVALGACNDWNSVVRHGIYDYGVPHFFPWFSSIPLWMLLFWGMILRFIATLCRWRWLGPPEHPADRVHLPGKRVDSAVLKVSLEILLVVATRQLIYRWYRDPLLSWLPFALALLAYAALFRCSRHDRALMLLAAVAGPVVEVAYIHLGGLHRYHLGWLGGVPLWIVLWWALALPIWKDVSLRLQRGLRYAGW